MRTFLRAKLLGKCWFIPRIGLGKTSLEIVLFVMRLFSFVNLLAGMFMWDMVGLWGCICGFEALRHGSTFVKGVAVLLWNAACTVGRLHIVGGKDGSNLRFFSLSLMRMIWLCRQSFLLSVSSLFKKTFLVRLVAERFTYGVEWLHWAGCSE